MSNKTDTGQEPCAYLEAGRIRFPKLLNIGAQIPKAMFIHHIAKPLFFAGLA
jgi:hypothetical protein